MLAAGYLKIRDDLAELIRYTRALAKRSQTSLEEDELELEEQLGKPLRIVVCGENGAGKTTFLEKLLNLSLDDVKPSAVAVSIIRHSSYRVFKKEEGACEKFYHRDLKDIELIDVRGLSQLSTEQSDALDGLLKGSDFVFWVLPASNPWAAGSWDKLSRVHQHLSGKVALVLQQVDRREASDIPMLMGHMRDLSRQRLGETLSMFAVSAQSGLGMDQCFSLLDNTLNRSLSRRRQLREIYRQTYAILRRTEETIDERWRTLSGNQEYLQSIEAQIDRLREEEVSSLKFNLSQLGKLLQSQIARVMRFTSLRTGMVSTQISLFGKGDLATKVEQFLIERVTDEAESFAKEESKRMREQCRGKWEAMRPALEERLTVAVGDFDDDSFDEQHDVFCEGMVKSTRYGLLGLKLRRFLDSLVMSRYHLMRKLLKLALVWIIVGAFSGFMSSDALGIIPLTLTSIGVCFLLVSIVYGRRTGRVLNQSFGESLEDAVPALRKALQDGYIERVRAFYNGFTPMFENMRRHVAEAKNDLQPQQKVAGQLFLRMKSLERDI